MAIEASRLSFQPPSLELQIVNPCALLKRIDKLFIERMKQYEKSFAVAQQQDRDINIRNNNSTKENWKRVGRGIGDDIGGIAGTATGTYLVEEIASRILSKIPMPPLVKIPVSIVAYGIALFVGAYVGKTVKDTGIGGAVGGAVAGQISAIVPKTSSEKIKEWIKFTWQKETSAMGYALVEIAKRLGQSIDQEEKQQLKQLSKYVEKRQSLINDMFAKTFPNLNDNSAHLL